MGINDFYQTLANSHPVLTAGFVQCEKCGNSQQVDSARALKNGWPKCCGLTMTLKARAALASAGGE